MVFKDLDDCATAATGSANETRYAFEVTQVNTSRPTCDKIYIVVGRDCAYVCRVCAYVGAELYPTIQR
jgi:hypothetical protein